MKIRLNKTDFVFGTALVFTVLFLGYFLFSFPYSHDETFYLTIPFRLINGDSLIKDEWHLTQFSSFFSYLPNLLWIKLTGSTEGIVVFMRCVYLFIQIVLAVVIYCFFRKYKLWAVVAAVLFFTQFVSIIQQISYHSMFVCFLLLLALSIISIYENRQTCSYIFAGLFYGLCCICNPFFCLAFILYLISCVMWKYRKQLSEGFFKLIEIIENYIKQKTSSPAKKVSKKKKSKRVKPTKASIFLQNIENYNCFFAAKSVGYAFCGLFIVAIVAVIFFFATGGTVSTIFENIENIFASSEYQTSRWFDKFIYAHTWFNDLVHNKGFLLPILFIVLLVDKKRTTITHRYVYIILSFLLSVVYFIDIFSRVTDDIYFFEFPLLIFSLVSYIITKNKNQTLFFCMWLPCALASVFQLLASASILSAMNVVLIASNTAGVFFIADLFKEMKSERKAIQQKQTVSFEFLRYILCIALSFQLLGHLSFFQIALYTPSSTVKAETGPYLGIQMTEEQAEDYAKTITDLNLIKERISPYSPVYVASWQNWMYLHLERPIGAYTSYYYGEPDIDTLYAYYQQSPEHIPEYIYLPSRDYFNNVYYEYSTEKNLELFSELFEFDIEELPNGTLLKLKEYKSNYANLYR